MHRVKTPAASKWQSQWRACGIPPCVQGADGTSCGGGGCVSNLFKSFIRLWRLKGAEAPHSSSLASHRWSCQMACGTHMLPPGENACAVCENACHASSLHHPTKAWVHQRPQEGDWPENSCSLPGSAQAWLVGNSGITVAHRKLGRSIHGSPISPITQEGYLEILLHCESEHWLRPRRANQNLHDL